MLRLSLFRCCWCLLTEMYLIISEMSGVPIIDLSKRDAIIDFEKSSINYLREIKQIIVDKQDS